MAKLRGGPVAQEKPSPAGEAREGAGDPWLQGELTKKHQRRRQRRGRGEGRALEPWKSRRAIERYQDELKTVKYPGRSEVEGQEVKDRMHSGRWARTETSARGLGDDGWEVKESQ